MKKYYFGILSILLLLPNLSLASEVLDNLKEAGVLSGLDTEATPTAIIAGIINGILGLTGSIFVVLIIWAGFRWMTSGGNTDQIKKARETIINSAIGLGIIIASYVIVRTIFTILQGGTLGGGGTGVISS